MVHLVDRMKLTSEMIAELPMTFIVSPQHHLAAKKNVMSHQLLDEVFIICEEDSANYHKIQELFRKSNNRSSNLLQIKDQNAIKHAVMANLGISVLPDYFLQVELKHNMLIPLIIDDFINPITAAYWVQRENKKLSPTAQLFKAFLFDELKGKCINDNELIMAE